MTRRAARSTNAHSIRIYDIRKACRLLICSGYSVAVFVFCFRGFLVFSYRALSVAIRVLLLLVALALPVPVLATAAGALGTALGPRSPPSPALATRPGTAHPRHHVTLEKVLQLCEIEQHGILL